MMQWNLVILIIYMNFLHHLHTYPSGAPQSTCQSMRPIHGAEPQSSRSPFQVVADDSGNIIKVTIEHESKTVPFRGFLIKAFQDDTEINGEFVSDATLTRPLKCVDGEKSGLTHSSSDDKLTITTTWKPLQKIDGEVLFRATVVQTAPVFWVQIPSNKVKVNTDGIQVGPTRKTSSSSTSLLTTAVPSTDTYSGCGSSKGCFGIPGDCVTSKTCQVVLTYSKTADETGINFQMVGGLGSTDGWIAMGLSSDRNMGNDVVTECLYSNNKVVVRESWNFDEPRKGNRVFSAENSNISALQVQHENNVISCTWTRPYHTISNGMVFDMANDTFYLLLAKGPTDQSGEKIFHNAYQSSATKVDLKSAALIQARSQIFIKIHGAFMTAAWIGFVSIAILVARHYKEVWSKYMLCGVKVWFAVHRCFMLISLGLMVVGFIIIFVEVGGWSQTGLNPHPILGCVATLLGVMQPFVAMMRPPPDHPKRPIFRWVHGLIGNGGQLIAVINMFFAVTLGKSNLPQAFNWVLVTFIIFHCLAHLLIHIHSCLMARERDRGKIMHTNGLQFTDSYTVNETDGAGSAFKKFALALYSAVTTGITIALILMICLN